MVNEDVDVLIIGGGLTGAALLLALAHTGLNIRLIDAKLRANALLQHNESHFDARSLALSPASVRILDKLSVWSALSPLSTAIQSIQVSERHQFGKTRLQGDANNPLGYVVEMQDINAALHARLPKHAILAPAQLLALNPIDGTAVVLHDQQRLTIQAKLIVAADGTESTTRTLCGMKTQQHSYQQSALVTNVGLARAHRHQAIERFAPKGPLALLPLSGSRASLVWALPAAEAMQWQHTPEPDFLVALQRHVGYALGRFTRVGQRAIYPLQRMHVDEPILGRVVLIGNAAHTLHPVAGQGFNLGLRDVAMLAQCIVQQGFAPTMLNTYQSLRALDQTRMRQFTDGLIQLFSNPIPGMAFARSMGLMAMDILSPLKQQLLRYASGFTGIIPDLACGIPLTNNSSHKEHPHHEPRHD